MLDLCYKRDDDWALKVKKLLLSCHDLVAAEARYHQKCYIYFHRRRSSVPQQLSSPTGRPVDSIKSVNFIKLCEWLETECELYSLSELRSRLIEISSSEDVYEVKSIKNKLVRYGEHVFFATVAGRSNVVTLGNTADYLLNEQWYSDRKDSTQEQAERIIITAAKLILSDIRAADFDCNFYPANQCFENTTKAKEWLPPYLRLFRERLIKQPLRQVSVGQCIVNVTRPRSVIAPIPFGLGVEVDHVFGSKWLLNELSALGFSVSPDEVLRYRQSVTENENTADLLKECLPGSFTQWMADSADHNPMTLDGKGSLHAVGSCAATTYHGDTPYNHLPQIIRQKRKPASTVTHGKGIPVIQYNPPQESGLSKLFFKHMLKLQTPYALPPDTTVDMLWHAAYFFSKGQRPGWSGFMPDVSVGNYPGKATISFLPILDLDPSDLTCIYSVLLFIIEQAKILGIHTPVVTFDQPLWLKATEVVNTKSLPIVLILGGFHLMMSFLGSMGSIMKGSGLQEALGTIYGTNTVEHITSGKAVSRALRGHFLTESALVTKLLRKFFPDTLFELDENMDEEEQESDITLDEETEAEKEEEPEYYDEDNNEITNEWIESLGESVFKKVDVDMLNALSESIWMTQLMPAVALQNQPN